MASVNADRQAGSGFAMFSSVDFAGSRTVVITADHQGDPVTVQPPESFEGTIDALLLAPTASAAQDLARNLDLLSWDRYGEVMVEGTHSPLRDITVTVRGLRSDGRELGTTILAQGSSS